MNATNINVHVAVPVQTPVGHAPKKNTLKKIQESRVTQFFNSVLTSISNFFSSQCSKFSNFWNNRKLKNITPQVRAAVEEEGNSAKATSPFTTKETLPKSDQIAPKTTEELGFTPLSHELFTIEEDGEGEGEDLDAAANVVLTEGSTSSASAELLAEESQVESGISIESDYEAIVGSKYDASGSSEEGQNVHEAIDCIHQNAHRWAQLCLRDLKDKGEESPSASDLYDKTILHVSNMLKNPKFLDKPEGFRFDQNNLLEFVEKECSEIKAKPAKAKKTVSFANPLVTDMGQTVPKESPAVVAGVDTVPDTAVSIAEEDVAVDEMPTVSALKANKRMKPKAPAKTGISTILKTALLATLLASAGGPQGVFSPAQPTFEPANQFGLVPHAGHGPVAFNDPMLFSGPVPLFTQEWNGIGDLSSLEPPFEFDRALATVPSDLFSQAPCLTELYPEKALVSTRGLIPNICPNMQFSLHLPEGVSLGSDFANLFNGNAIPLLPPGIGMSSFPVDSYLPASRTTVKELTGEDKKNSMKDDLSTAVAVIERDSEEADYSVDVSQSANASTVLVPSAIALSQPVSVSSALVPHSNSEDCSIPKQVLEAILRAPNRVAAITWNATTGIAQVGLQTTAGIISLAWNTTCTIAGGASNMIRGSDQ